MKSPEQKSASSASVAEALQVMPSPTRPVDGVTVTPATTGLVFSTVAVAVPVPVSPSESVAVAVEYV